MIYFYKEKKLKIVSSVFIVDYVMIIGDVYVGEELSIWFNIVICGDVLLMIIGD